MRLHTIFLAAALLSLAAPAAAQERIEYEAVTELNFDDDTIQGDLTRPDGELIEAKGKVKHSNLIKVRESFREQILESVGEL